MKSDRASDDGRVIPDAIINKHLLIILITISVCVWPGGGLVTEVALDLFIMAGQSNMQGYMGNAENYPKDACHDDRRIRFFYIEPSLKRHESIDSVGGDKKQEDLSAVNGVIDGMRKSFGKMSRAIRYHIYWPPAPSPSGVWTRLGPQWGRFPNGHFGPEVSFSRHLQRGGYSPAVFKYSRGSTSLADDWKGPGEGGLYDHFFIALRTAIQDLKNEGYQVNIRGLIWIQGENDALTDEAAVRYESRLVEIISHLRMNILGPGTPIILGADEAHPMMLSRPQVRVGQENIAKSDPCIIRSSMLGLEKADFTHLTSPALVAHGTRLYHDYGKVSSACVHK